jgi:hypothetical protein
MAWRAVADGAIVIVVDGKESQWKDLAALYIHAM